MTRIEMAKKGIITDEVKFVAAAEGLSPEQLSEDIAAGVSVIPINRNHKITPLGIGRMMRTKINANIGTSKDKISIDSEMEKLEVLVKYGADAVMDLSTGGPIKELRKMMLSRSPVAVGTVPIYEAAVRAAEQKGSIAKMTAEDLFAVIEEHAAEGVDFVTVHSGLTMKAVERLKTEG
ncbi:MAG: phosphomethylpyrimidine synthase ThiC, partial [Nitrospirota bacterium]|nr:phosphomethylpyrimidine synthase ThiC [Nitrospirota bacterium]